MTHPPCSACGAPDTPYWVCTDCERRWKDAETLSVVAVFNMERKRRGLPPTDEWWTGRERLRKPFNSTA